MVKQGYLIVQKIEAAFKTYKDYINERPPHDLGNEEKLKNRVYLKYLKKIKKLVSDFNLLNYKGISRFPINPEDFGISSEDEVFNDTVFIHLGTAKKILSQVENKDDYEIIKISSPEAVLNFDGFLGYDVGYFGGDGFSAICDSFIMPRWHPLAISQIDEFLSNIKSLNDNLLFPNEKLAQEFCDYYLRQDWAEESYENDIRVVGVFKQ